MSEWISVSDRLPDENYETDYLISDGKSVTVGCYLGEDRWCPRIRIGKIIHWMPLPEKCEE